MRILTLILVAVGLLSPSIYAAECLPLPASSYAGVECTVTDEFLELDDFTFKDIGWSSFPPTPQDPDFVHVPGSQVLLTPFVQGGNVGMAYGNIGDQDVFNIGVGQRIRAFLLYHVDPDPPIFDDLSLDFSGSSPTGDAWAQMTLFYCAGARLETCATDGGEPGSLFLRWDGDQPNPPAVSATFRPVNEIDVFLVLDMFGGTQPGSRSQIDGGTAISTVVPEPATVGITAASAIALLLLRRRLARG
jgi:hypothetical protein